MGPPLRDLETASPESIARLGHIAILLRRYLEQTGMSVRDFNIHILKIGRNSTMVYPWLKAGSQPGRSPIQRMSRAMGVPAVFFEPNALGAPAKQPPETLKVPRSWTDRGETPAQETIALPAPKLLGRPAGSTNPPLTFRINGDGTARITVDVTLPVGRVTSILRVLLEAGLEEASMLTEPS